MTRTGMNALKRGLVLPLLPLAVLLVLFDDLFRGWVGPAVARLARLAPFRRLEGWIRGLSSYATLALFLVPMVAIWPLKLFALYLIGAGHWGLGGVVLVVAKVVGVGIAERLFAVSRDKLLSIGWFARCFAFAVRVKVGVHAALVRTRLWRMVGAVVGWIRAALAALRLRLRALVGTRRGDLVGGARRLVARYRPAGRGGPA